MVENMQGRYVVTNFALPQLICRTDLGYFVLDFIIGHVNSPCIVGLWSRPKVRVVSILAPMLGIPIVVLLSNHIEISGSIR